MVLGAVLVLGGCKPEKPDTAERGKEARARVTAYGLDDKEGPGAQGGTEAPTPDRKGLTEEEKALVVAKIGDGAITLGDVERQLMAQPAFARARYSAFDKKVEFLNNLVQFELLARESKAKGYDTDPDVVLAMKRAMIQKFTQNDLQKLVTVSKIEDAEIQRYYENNKTLFQKPEQVRASHILFKTKEEAEKSLAEIQAAVAADVARARIIFAEFARRVSKDDESAQRNGDLDFFSKDGYGDEPGAHVPAPVAAAAFALTKTNEVSPVVEAPDGFHLVQLPGRRPAVNRSLDEARRQITNTLLREKKDQARDAFIKGLREKAHVTIDEEQLKKIDVEAPVPPPPGQKPRITPDMVVPPPGDEEHP